MRSFLLFCWLIYFTLQKQMFNLIKMNEDEEEHEEEVASLYHFLLPSLLLSVCLLYVCHCNADYHHLFICCGLIWLVYVLILLAFLLWCKWIINLQKVYGIFHHSLLRNEINYFNFPQYHHCIKYTLLPFIHMTRVILLKFMAEKRLFIKIIKSLSKFSQPPPSRLLTDFLSFGCELFIYQQSESIHTQTLMNLIST